MEVGQGLEIGGLEGERLFSRLHAQCGIQLRALSLDPEIMT